MLGNYHVLIYDSGHYRWILTMLVMSMFLNFLRFCLLIAAKWLQVVFCWLWCHTRIYELSESKGWDLHDIPRGGHSTETVHNLDTLYHWESTLSRHKGRCHQGHYFWCTCLSGGCHQRWAEVDLDACIISALDQVLKKTEIITKGNEEFTQILPPGWYAAQDTLGSGQ